ncbi:MAG: hypothetical protein M3092_05135 [Actinomycetia bacterium]|nr:hypothetical protein [Actinomycetes bacterium]
MTEPIDIHTMSQEPSQIPAWRRLLELCVFVALSTLVVFVLSAIGLVLYTQGTAGTGDVTVVIPVGSSELITDGENVLDVPPVWTFSTDDTLTLDNRDLVAHTLGDQSVAANQSLVIVMDLPSDRDLPTTLHPLGVVTVNVEPSGYDFSLIAYPTFAFGISVGIIVYVGFSIARAMGRHDDEDWVDR